MFALSVRQRIAALVLLAFLATGGLLLFFNENKSLTQGYVDDGTSNPIYADVRGAVAKPGLIRLKPGSRKFEALEQAGGVLPDADLNRINQAEFVEDGEQIYLPRKGEILEPPSGKKTRTKTVKKTRDKKNKIAQNAISKANSDKDSETIKSAVTPKWPLDINAAGAEQLEAVPGIGRFLASKIVEYRNQNGNFQSFEDLDKVYGIGPGKLEKLRPYLCVK